MTKERLAIQTLRVLSVEQHESCIDILALLRAALMIHALSALFAPLKRLKLDKSRPFHPGGRALLTYIRYASLGYNLTQEDLANFRQFGSITAGHPECDLTPGVDATSGPLGQGIAEGAGMALAEAFLAEKFNRDELKLIDHYTYVLCGDGDLQEGVTQEAISLAGHLGLNKLIVLYDSNDIQLDGEVKNANSENIREKYEAMNWNYLHVRDGEDVDAVVKAIKKAQDSTKPTIIEIKTIIGRGSASENTSKVHGSPLPKEEVDKMRADLGGQAFGVDSSVYEFIGKLSEKEAKKLIKSGQKHARNIKKNIQKLTRNLKDFLMMIS